MKKYKVNEKIGSYIHPSIKVLKNEEMKDQYNLGVFALKDIEKGIVIERAPFLEINGNKKLSEPLQNYVFQSHLKETDYLLLFGYGSMYNHSNNNNVSYYLDNQDRFFKYITNRKINSGEELFINYGVNHSVNEK